MFTPDGADPKIQGSDEDKVSLASWALLSEDVASAADWLMVEPESDMSSHESEPEKVLDHFVGPLEMNGIDFSQISFLLGEWIDSLGHSVSVVATGGCSARARISWDHKGQKKTPLWKTFLKVAW